MLEVSGILGYYMHAFLGILPTYTNPFLQCGS